jgi:hypothetical protein
MASKPNGTIRGLFILSALPSTMSFSYLKNLESNSCVAEYYKQRSRSSLYFFLRDTNCGTLNWERFRLFTMNNRMKRCATPLFVASAAVLSIVAFGLQTQAAFAAMPANPECWGVVTSQRAVAEGDVGEHSSDQEEPRLGLRNVAQLFELEHVSDLGTVLAELDEVEETSCP